MTKTHDKRTETHACDLISRQAALDALNGIEISRNASWYEFYQKALTAVGELPSAQPERDIPKKPISTTDRAWGIPLRQAVCPNCDVYLGMIHFISENGKTKVTYCETCGQAIDWEGWDYDE